MRLRSSSLGRTPGFSLLCLAFLTAGPTLCGRPATAWASPSDANGRASDRATAMVLYGRGLYDPTYTLGLEYPIAPQRSAAVDWELSPTSGVLSPRASYHLQLTAPRFVTVAATVGVTTAVVYRGDLNAGFGPRVGLGAALGPSWLRLDVAAQAGAEIFVHEIGPRIPVRGIATLRTTLSDFTAGVTVRAGYDYEPDRYALPRFEALAFIGTSAFDER